MSIFNELVQSARLETGYRSSNTTVHIYHEIGRHASQRSLRREEIWEKKKDIGHGAYGSVWLEECFTGFETKVRAVKSIKKFNPYRPSESSNRDFARELAAVTKFSHPRYETCFVKSTGWYENDDTIFIAMEYLRHGDLQAYLNRTPIMPELQGREIAFQVGQGLYYMHQHGFAHRDLKPGNILIMSMPPDSWWIKLCDFGTSKNLTHDITRSTVKGTLAYMAPEILKMVDAFKEESSMDNTDVDNKAVDMWALGEICIPDTYRETIVPKSAHAVETCRKRMFSPLDRLRSLQISDDACHFVENLMKVRPEDRLTAQEALREKWMEVYGSTVSELLGYSTLSPPMVSSSTKSSPEPALEPSAEWSTAVTGRTRNPFRMHSHSPSIEVTEHSDHPAMIWSSRSEDDLSHALQSTLDWRSGSASDQTNNPYRNGLFQIMTVAAGKEAPISTGSSSLTADSNPFLRWSEYSHVSDAPSNDSGIGDMSGEASYNADGSNDKSPVRSSTPSSPSPRKDEGAWRTKFGDFGDFVKDKVKRLEGLITEQTSPRPASQGNPTQDSMPGGSLSKEIVVGEPSGQQGDPEATIHDSTIVQKSPALPKRSEAITLQSTDSRNSVTQPKLTKSGVPEPIPGLQIIEMGDASYRKQVHDLVAARRLRRQNAEIELALEHGIEVDLVTGSLTEDGHRIGERRVDSFFQFSIKIWFGNLLKSQYSTYARQTLTLMRIRYSESDAGFECWSEASGDKESIHFKFAFWLEEGVSIQSPIPFLIDKKMVFTAGTNFRFERLSGDLEQWEDLMEKVVGVFENRWYADPDNPR